MPSPKISSIEVSAYRSHKKDELYVFVPKEEGLGALPAEFKVMFGEPVHVIDFTLTPERKMGRENPLKVMQGILTKGYFVQMPPQEKEKISDMPAPPDHLNNIY